MASFLFSDQLLDYLESYHEMNALRKKEMAKGTIGMFGNFIYDFSVPGSWCLRDIERMEQSELIFHWTSNSDQAACSVCKKISHNRVKTYLTRRIQDLPMSGMTVYHAIKANRYNCENPACSSITFIEQFEEFADKDARLSNRLKDFTVRQAIDSSSNGTAKTLKKIGIRVNNDTINQEVKKKSAQVIADNLKRDDIHALSVDDINLRKGDSSTACTVFIDAETHRVLIIVQGATGEIATKIMEQYPSTTILSRDRGTAYASAGTKCGKTQVADRFHLVQNMHKAIKEALGQEIAKDLFVREGDGWTTMVDRAYEKPALGSFEEEDHHHGLVVIQPATLTVEDMETRIHLAGLQTRQANKYRKTIAILEWTEKGLRTSDIMKRLSMKKVEVFNYRKEAHETIKRVEVKIDEYYQMREKGQWEYHQKTIATRAKLSSESIVEPYKKTVLRMFEEGTTHRHIHPVIVKEGFQGSANAVYQYLIKYAHENHIPYGHNARVIPLEERNDHSEIPRPPRISIERTSQHTIYASLLHAAALRKDEIKQALLGLAAAPNDSQIADHPSTPIEPVEWINTTNYADSIAKLILNTKPKGQSAKKKLNEEAFEHLGEAYPMLPLLVTILVAFYEVMLSLDVNKLDEFICKYQNDSIEPIATFASGLRKDYDAVKNSLLYPQISNGPIEGVNNKIKMMRRRCYGRAGIELINALAVLPGYYKDKNKNSELQQASAA